MSTYIVFECDKCPAQEKQELDTINDDEVVNEPVEMVRVTNVAGADHLCKKCNHELEQQLSNTRNRFLLPAKKKKP